MSQAPTVPTPALAGPFALGTFAGPEPGARRFAGLLVGDRVRDLSGLGAAPPTVLDLVRDWSSSMRLFAELAGDPRGAWRPVAELTVCAPLAPGQILQSGANYRQHVVDLVAAERHSVHGRTTEEARADAEQMMDERIAAGVPYVFYGSPRAICGPYDDIVLPDRGTQHDWELELAVVIGRTARRVSRADAMGCVAAYTICNDITTRDLVHRADLKGIGTDWFASKNAATFLPTGPYLVPARFVADPMDLRITLRHNGVVRQNESTKDMIFDIARLIEYASAVVELRPGDLLLTGSPAGNGAHWRVFLAEGDLLDGEIAGLGAQRNRCVREAAVTS